MFRKTGKQVLFIILALSMWVGLYSQSLSTLLESDTIWMGESTRLTLVLEDSKEEIAPPLSIPGITVTPLGGSSQNSQSITTVNGKTTRQVFYKYLYSYELTPTKPGGFTIPSITVSVDGKTLSTRRISLTVRKPEKNENYHMLIEADKSTAYPGQEITIKVSLLFGKSIRSLYFEIPGFEKLELYPVAPQKGGSKQEVYHLQVNGDTFPFARTDRTYRGNEYAGVTGTFKASRTKTGSLQLRDAIAVFEGTVGTQRVRDLFGRVTEQDVYEKIVIPSDPLSITVLPYPEQGRPEDFFGLAGDISMKVQAKPREVRIGDPITLEIQLFNVNDPYVVVPQLKSYLGDAFKIPETRSPDTIEGKTKTITQTIRAMSEQTTEIPPLSIPFFNTETGKYEYLSSSAIPISVQPTAMLGVEDLEGMEETEKITTEKTRDGIYFNYAGEELLVSRQPAIHAVISNIWFRISLLLPPLLAFGLFLFYRLFPHIQKRQIEKRTIRQHFRSLEKNINKGDSQTLINSFLVTHFNIQHYSQLGEIMTLTNDERQNLDNILKENYRNTNNGNMNKNSFDADVILSIIRGRI